MCEHRVPAKLCAILAKLVQSVQLISNLIDHSGLQFTQSAPLFTAKQKEDLEVAKKYLGKIFDLFFKMSDGDQFLKKMFA